jgi:hypothetical protein
VAPAVEYIVLLIPANTYYCEYPLRVKLSSLLSIYNNHTIAVWKIKQRAVKCTEKNILNGTGFNSTYGMRELPDTL